jgi:hypothetical protein
LDTAFSAASSINIAHPTHRHIADLMPHTKLKRS